MLHFRQGRAEDARQLTELALAAKRYWGYSEAFMQSCAAELHQTPEKIKDPRFTYRVALFEQSIVGFFCIEAMSDDEAELEALFLSPRYIGMGFGRECWQALLLLASHQRITRLSIASDPNALPFYLKMGAKEIGEIPSESIQNRVLPQLEYTVPPCLCSVEP